MTSGLPTVLRITYLESDPAAVAQVRSLFAEANIEAEIDAVADAVSYRRSLNLRTPDAILAECTTTGLDAANALAVKQELCPNIPLIFVLSTIDAEAAIDCLHNGADDIVLKKSISRLVPAISNALARGNQQLERLRSEQALRQSEERFRRLVANAPDAIFRYRLVPTPGYDYISPAIEQIVGYRPEEFYADPELSAKLVPPGERDEMQSIVTKRVVPIGPREIRWLTRNQETVHTEQRLVPVRNSLGQLVAVEGVARDITARKRTDDHIRLLSEAIAQSPVGILVADSKNRILFANAKMHLMCEYSRQDLDGQPPRMLLSPNNPTGIEDEIRHCLTEGRNWQGDLACRKRSGQDYTVRASITPVFDQNGQVRHFLAIHEDVTAVREEQERRRTLEAKLFQAQKMETIGTLAGGIAHDFNNILTGILGFTEMAGLSLPEDHPAHQDLTEVRKAGNRAKELVAQILTFSRQTHVQAVPLELAEATDEALKLIRASAPATIELVRELLPGCILADPTAIHQVVLNLCTNAVHAMRGKVGRLTVRVAPCSFTEPVCDTHPRLKPGGYMCLTVSDTGHGMDDATLNRLFEPFFTTKKPGEGTGLGLALVRGIVADHSGGMRVTSQVGEGTTFQIFMPVCLETRDPKPLDEPVVHGGGETVAVIDDESSIATFVSSRLEQLNYRPVVFHSAPKAHEALMASPGRFQALVTDLTMPQITGSELLRQLRAAGIGIPAVLMTGVYFEDTVDDPVAHLSRTVILRKPFDGDDLARAVHECLATPLG